MILRHKVIVLVTVIMECKVFCIIGERYKRVKFVKENHLSDAECLRQALTKARVSDNILDNMMRGKGIVLQKNIPGKNKLCDIEEDDEICADSDVTVLLVDLNPTFQALVAIATTSNKTIDCAQNVEAGDIIEIDIPVLFEEKADVADNLASDYIDIQANAVDLNSSKTSKRSKKSESRQTDKSGPGTVPNPAPLPQLTAELDDMRKKIGVLEGQRSFIYFWANHLSAITNNQPTKRDYFHYASSIVAAYPELKGGKGDCGIVKTQLSTCIRNRKATIKKRCNKIVHKPVKSAPIEMASLVIDKEPTQIQIDVEDALKELQKSKGDTPHVRRLLKDTFYERRKWIQNDAKRISEVVEKFPYLKLDTLVLSEFCTIKKWKEEEEAIESFITKVDAMIEVLRQHFGCKQNELGKAQSLLKFYESVTNKRFRKNTPLFIVKEAMSSTQDLMTVEGNSPRLVMFTMEGAIAAAYVVADEIRMKIVEPSVCKSIACLLASYYVWDTKYPNAYKNTMEYMDHEILGTVMKENAAIDKFIRDRNRTRSYE